MPGLPFLPIGAYYSLLSSLRFQIDNYKLLVQKFKLSGNFSPLNSSDYLCFATTGLAFPLPFLVGLVAPDLFAARSIQNCWHTWWWSNHGTPWIHLPIQLETQKPILSARKTRWITLPSHSLTAQHIALPPPRLESHSFLLQFNYQVFKALLSKVVIDKSMLGSNHLGCRIKFLPLTEITATKLS